MKISKISVMRWALALLICSIQTTRTEMVLDESFGGEGIIKGSEGRVTAAAMQPKKKIVLAVQKFIRNQTNAFLIRINVNGTLDTTFGLHGSGVTAVTPRTIFSSLICTPDGHKIIAAGQMLSPFSGEFATIACYTRDGVQDATFAGSGSTKIPESKVTALALQSGNAITVVGEKQKQRKGFSFLAHYDTDGVLDGTFGSHGVIKTPTTTQLKSLAIDSHNNILVIGSVTPAGQLEASESFFARYHADGTFDTTLSPDGKIIVISGLGELTSMVIQPDHKIVIAGYEQLIQEQRTAFLARYNEDGTPDRTFGSVGDGIVRAAHFKVFTSIVLQSDNKIIVSYPTTDEFPYKNSFARYNTNGTPDTTFGPHGSATLTGPRMMFNARLLQSPDGTLVIAGEKNSIGQPSTLLLARYKSLTPELIEQRRLATIAAQITAEINALMSIELLEKCAICLEHDDIHTLEVTRCNHLFHPACLNGWRTARQEGSPFCPLCRGLLHVEDEDEE